MTVKEKGSNRMPDRAKAWEQSLRITRRESFFIMLKRGICSRRAGTGQKLVNNLKQIINERVKKIVDRNNVIYNQKIDQTVEEVITVFLVKNCFMDSAQRISRRG
jgi:hypothetical protein